MTECEKNLATSLPKPEREILPHVELYGLTTATVVSRLFLDGDKDKPQASRQLDALVADRVLYRYGPFYMREPLRAFEIDRRYAVLWFCCMQNARRTLLTPEQLAKLTRPAAESIGAPPVRRALCYLDHKTKRLALIRVHVQRSPQRATNLNHVLGQLQTFVNDAGFRPWTYLARAREFMLTCLLSRRDDVREMTAWLRRRPLLSQLTNPPLEISVQVRGVQPAQ